MIYFTLILKAMTMLLIAPASLCACFNFAKIKSDYNLIYSYIFSFSIIPWIYVFLLRFFPHQNSFFYLILIVLPFFLLLILTRKFSKPFFEDFAKLKDLFKEANKYSLLCFVFLNIFIVLWFLQKPLLGNDPLQYFYLSGLIDQLKDISFYPSTSAVDGRGFVVPWSHPLGYPGLLAWGRLGLPLNDGLFFAKLCSFSAVLLLSLALLIVLYRETKEINFWASLLLLTTPICLNGFLECHVDGSRMLLFLCSFLIVFDYLKNNLNQKSRSIDVAYFSLLGFCFGFSWFFHSTGILTYVITIAASALFVFYVKKKEVSVLEILKKYIPLVILSTSCMIFVVCMDLYQSFKVHGKFLTDLENIKIFNYFASEYKSYYELSRGLTSLYEKCIEGIGKIFTDIKIFGIVYVLFLISLIIYFRSIKLKKEKTFLIHFSMFFVLLFLLFVFFCTFIGIDKFAFNLRYILQIHPIVCLAIALHMKRIWR